jgi:hypothetical protein
MNYNPLAYFIQELLINVFPWNRLPRLTGMSNPEREREM